MVPIVLHHGLFGYDQVNMGPIKRSYFNGIDKTLRSMGYPVILSRVHPTGGICRRATELKATIRQQLADMGLPGKKVVILAHSMGGLDARYLTSRLDMHDQVSAIVSLTTPHRGSPYADWVVRNLGIRLGALRLIRLLGIDMEGVLDVTTERCGRFNEEVKDVPGVRYFSVSAARPWHRVPPFAIHAHHTVYEAQGDNDGLVSVQSSRWAEHLGVWPADHWHTVNHRLVLELRQPTGDITPYWIKVVRHLEREGVLTAPAQAASEQHRWN